MEMNVTAANAWQRDIATTAAGCDLTPQTLAVLSNSVAQQRLQVYKYLHQYA